MEIKGLAKTTLLDYPGHVAATLFVGGCQFKCPFCHNGSLVTKASQLPNIPLDEVYSFLKKRKGVLDGVCVTGGEPTFQPDLKELLRDIKDMGYLVKLDTNGYDPTQLDHLFKEGLVDYVAMDIKNSPEKYAKTVGRTNLDINRIKLSVELIRESGLDYEFRTTIVKELHSIDDMHAIAEWLKGSRAYYLQSYVASEDVIMPVFSSYTKLELTAIKAMLEDFIPRVYLRGVE
ncbi:MAG: anaerobic ribonucleoside-triphosphate reductase activating protein [Clostridia bacterium]|jgi:pyruvate formate lyase activating enzyme|nr:anaerobic ribonucleoside-triphosphate reductase activating protein [Lachnospiraceae bacterium]NCB99329.1 anaerobic ribonucleoside-triphosphate reductase activating protein [Clostridia bacterium]NCD01568.1 anaerobic ribonucleoside-triphosphate reductase activating protein [Clostridia bacterium]